jgi:hypothetical protein
MAFLLMQSPLLLLASLLILVVFYVLYCTMRHAPDYQTIAIGVGTTVGKLISGFRNHRTSQLIAGGLLPSSHSLHPSHLTCTVPGTSLACPALLFPLPVRPTVPDRPFLCRLRPITGARSVAEVGKMKSSTFDPFDLGGGGVHGVQGQICHILTPASYEPFPAPSGHTDSHTLNTYIWGGGWGGGL